MSSTRNVWVDELLGMVEDGVTAMVGAFGVAERWLGARVAEVRPLAKVAREIHDQEQRPMSLDTEALSREQEIADARFTLSSTLLGGTAIVSLLHPSLPLLELPAILYLMSPVFRSAYREIVEEKRLTTNSVDSVFYLGATAFALAHPAAVVIVAGEVWMFSLTYKLIARSQNRTRRDMAEAFTGEARSVWVMRDPEAPVEVPVDSVVAGDVVVLQAGDTIPVDGTIVAGAASVDQVRLTGEVQPVDKVRGDQVFASTVILTGAISVRVEKAGVDTAVGSVERLLDETVDYTTSIQSRGQALANRAVAPTVALSALALPLVGPSGALAVLGSGIGYNMRLLTPISVLNHFHLATKSGIIIKDGRALEQLGEVDTVVFDKTGTLTLEVPQVGEIHRCGALDKGAILSLAAAAEQHQAHPIARAIRAAAAELRIEPAPVDSPTSLLGLGIQVMVGGEVVRVGSDRFMAMEGIGVPGDMARAAAEAGARGHTMIYVSKGDRLEGVIELRATIRPEAKAIVAALRKRGISLYILSGDHAHPTRALAAELGVDNYFAETLPEHKAGVIERLKAEGRKVCFIGDGLNDAIALKVANVSVSLSGAASVATDTAQIILRDRTLDKLDHLFDLSRSFERNMAVNLATTVVPGVAIIVFGLTGTLGLAGATAVYGAGLATGVGNAMRPLWAAGAREDAD